MAIYLKNTLFIHIPKTGGRWIVNAIEKHVRGWKRFGDKIYDGHASPPDDDKLVFAFVREPASFCDSLWRHRAFHTKNKWNWQDYLRLENECKSKNYDEWMLNCSKCIDGVVDYYGYYTNKYENLIFGQQENLMEDFIKILNDNDEDFDEDSIRNEPSIGVNKTPNRLTEDVRRNINNANYNFSLLYGYIL